MAAPCLNTLAQPVLACGLAAVGRYDADIFILVLNRFDDTVAAVRSALAQRSGAFHVTVLDQGSAPDIRARFTATFAGLERLGYFTIDHNLGVAGGRNVLARLGTGRVMVTLDNDAVFADEFVVAGAVAAFDSTPALGALGFGILGRDGVSLDEFSWGYPAALKSRRLDCFDTTTFVGAGHAIRRAAWAQAGGYDDRLFFTWEEYDFCLEAISRGWRIGYDGRLAVHHNVSPEARVAWSDERARLFVRNRLLISRKWRASWFSLAPRLAGYVVRGLRHRRLLPTLRGIAQAIVRDGSVEKRWMTPAMEDYLWRHEGRYRGSFWQRTRREVLGAGQEDKKVMHAGLRRHDEAGATATDQIEKKFFGYFFSKK